VRKCPWPPAAEEGNASDAAGFKDRRGDEGDVAEGPPGLAACDEGLHTYTGIDGFSAQLF